MDEDCSKMHYISNDNHDEDTQLKLNSLQTTIEKLTNSLKDTNSDLYTISENVGDKVSLLDYVSNAHQQRSKISSSKSATYNDNSGTYSSSTTHNSSSFTILTGSVKTTNVLKIETASPILSFKNTKPMVSYQKNNIIDVSSFNQRITENHSSCRSNSSVFDSRFPPMNTSKLQLSSKGNGEAKQTKVPLFIQKSESETILGYHLDNILDQPNIKSSKMDGLVKSCGVSLVSHSQIKNSSNQTSLKSPTLLLIKKSSIGLKKVVSIQSQNINQSLPQNNHLLIPLGNSDSKQALSIDKDKCKLHDVRVFDLNKTSSSTMYSSAVSTCIKSKSTSTKTSSSFMHAKMISPTPLDLSTALGDCIIVNSLNKTVNRSHMQRRKDLTMQCGNIKMQEKAIFQQNTLTPNSFSSSKKNDIHIKSFPSFTHSSKQMYDKCKKIYRPICNVGSARCNGLAPFKRVGTGLFNASSLITSPIVSQDKLLAINYELKSDLWKSVQLSSNIENFNSDHLYSSNTNEIIDLTDSSEIKSIEGKKKDGTNFDEMLKSSNITSGKDILVYDVDKLFERDSINDENVSALLDYKMNYQKAKILLNNVCIVSDNSAKFIGNCNDEQKSTFIDAEKSSTVTESIDRSKNPDLRDDTVFNEFVKGDSLTSENVSLKRLPFNNAEISAISRYKSCSLQKISRTLFALDRLYLNRKRLECHTIKAVVENLSLLRDNLILERSKQKVFLEGKLQFLKVKRKETISGSTWDEKTKTPAQRILEKFSLNAGTSPPEHTEKNKAPVVFRTGYNKDRSKTFSEVLAEQRKRKTKKEKSKMNILYRPPILTASNTGMKERGIDSELKISKSSYIFPSSCRNVSSATVSGTESSCFTRLTDDCPHSSNKLHKPKALITLSKTCDKEQDLSLSDTTLSLHPAHTATSDISHKESTWPVKLISSSDVNNEVTKTSSKLKHVSSFKFEDLYQRAKTSTEELVETVEQNDSKSNEIELIGNNIKSKRQKSIEESELQSWEMKCVVESNTESIKAEFLDKSDVKFNKWESIEESNTNSNKIEFLEESNLKTNKMESIEESNLQSNEMKFEEEIDLKSNKKESIEYSDLKSNNMEFIEKSNLKSYKRKSIEESELKSNKSESKEKSDSQSNQIKSENKSSTNLNKTMRIRNAFSTTCSSSKKKRTTEIDKLVDGQWNESWLKEDVAKKDHTGSIREKRALHYAMSRFAEMECAKEKIFCKTFDELNVDYQTGYKKGKKKQSSKIRIPEKDYFHTKGTDLSESTGLLGTSGSSISPFVMDLETLITKTNNSVHEISVKMRKSLNDEKPCVLGKRKLMARKSSDISNVIQTRNKYSRKSLFEVETGDAEMCCNKLQSNKHCTLSHKNLPLKTECGLKMLYPMENVIKDKVIQVSKHTGETILHKAARLGYPGLVERNILAGSDVNTKDHAGWSALHEACIYGNLAIAKILLKHGADPNCLSNNGSRPLHDAVEKTDIQMIRTLLSYGADPSIASYKGFLPINCTSNYQVKRLLKGFDIDINIIKNDICEDYWMFSGSCDIIDDESHFDIFEDVPGEKSQGFEIEMSSKPIPTSYYLPLINDKTGLAGYRNYFILKDILDRVNMSRTSFLKKLNVVPLKLPLKSFLQCLKSAGIAENPDMFSSRCQSSNFVELILIGHQSFRKLLGLKKIKIDL